MDAVLPERVLQLWPERAVPNTRNWVAENLHSARLHDIQLGWRRNPGGEDKLYLGFGFDGANVTYARDMPLLTDAAGQASLTGQRFVVSATRGRVTPPEGGMLDLAGTSFIIPDVRQRPARAQVRLVGQGSITAGLSMLDSPNLRLIERAGRAVDLADGQAEVTALMDEAIAVVAQQVMTDDQMLAAAEAAARAEALAAVLNPPASDELFFVADGTGGHAFARTYDEHLANVARWREIERRKAGLPPEPAPAAASGSAADGDAVPPGVVVPPGAQVIRVPQPATMP